MEKGKKREKVIVVGAGPVGSLAALYAANRGNDVEVYELRGGKLRNNRQPFIAFSIMLSGTRIFGCFANKHLPYFRGLRFLQACFTCLIRLRSHKASTLYPQRYHQPKLHGLLTLCTRPPRSIQHSLELHKIDQSSSVRTGHKCTPPLSSPWPPGFHP
jgi:hypothetical protein